MEMKQVSKAAFCVIGKEGSTAEEEGFVQRLWQDANTHFDEVRHLAKRDEAGEFVGFWGAMTDPSRSFLPWIDGFRNGLYLAGVECMEDATAPAGWTKWEIPGFVYLCCDSFAEGVAYLREKGIALVGAAQDFTDPKTGKNYVLFPIQRI